MKGEEKVRICFSICLCRILNRTQDRLWLIFWDIDWLISSSTIREVLLRDKHQDFLDTVSLSSLPGDVTGNYNNNQVLTIQLELADQRKIS